MTDNHCNMEIRCVFRAHYKTAYINFYDLGQFEMWLPETEAVRLLNDREGRERLFRLHFPTCQTISRDVDIELHERR